MKKSKSGFKRAKESDEEIDAYYEEACRDALLYWVNATVATAGVNTTLTALVEMLCSCVERVVPADQLNRAEDVILGALEKSFAEVRNGEGLMSPEKDHH